MLAVHRGVWLRAECWARGARDAELLSRLPTLARILERSQALMRDAPGRTYLSLMTQGTNVKPHCGPTNHRLRVHLPLLLPARSEWGIVVGGERRTWELGRCLVLDDSFEHSVDLSNGPPAGGASAQVAEEQHLSRVVLVADCWHPDAEWLVPLAERR